MPVTVPDHVFGLAHSLIDLSAPYKVRIAQAMAWLRVYPDETAASVARLYNIKPVRYIVFNSFYNLETNFSYY